MAVPRNNLNTLERVLRAAKLKPVTFGVGISAVQPAAGDTQRVITLLVRSNCAIDLQVSGGGGIVACAPWTAPLKRRARSSGFPPN
jgi:hypothetical protein